MFHICNGGHGCGEGCACPCHFGKKMKLERDIPIREAAHCDEGAGMISRAFKVLSTHESDLEILWIFGFWLYCVLR